MHSAPVLVLFISPGKQCLYLRAIPAPFQLTPGRDIYDQQLPASIIDQYEAGVKTDLLRRLLSVNVTLYKIINSNMAQTALTLADGTNNSNSNIKELAGEVTSKGIELDIATKSINGFTILAGYSYNDTRYTESNNKNFTTGDRLRYNPAHTANANVFYAFSPKAALNGFNIGLGTYYVGDRVAGRNPSTTNPGIQADAITRLFLV